MVGRAHPTCFANLKAGARLISPPLEVEDAPLAERGLRGGVHFFSEFLYPDIWKRTLSKGDLTLPPCREGWPKAGGISSFPVTADDPILPIPRSG